MSQKSCIFAGGMGKTIENIMNEQQEIHFSEFDEYIRQGEPDQREKAGIWSVAIGLQQVDGLQTSDFLRQTAKRNIEGEISMEEAGKVVRAYYASKSQHDTINEDEQEADRVSANIAAVLRSKTFNFSTLGYTSVHRRIFDGVMNHAGEVRKFDITKKEWVLQGDTVLYLNWEDLHRALDYDLEQEKRFSYIGLNPDEMIAHLSRFVSSLWQIHAFSEGNTRTTAVFTILYLRSLGWQVNNDMFAKHAWYFRNALVRANYHNYQLGVEYTFTYLERFFRNLLLGEQWDLRSRYLHIAAPEEWRVQPQLGEKTRDKNEDFTKTRDKISQLQGISAKTRDNLLRIWDYLLLHPTVKNKDIATLLSLSDDRARVLLLTLANNGILRYHGVNKDRTYFI